MYKSRFLRANDTLPLSYAKRDSQGNQLLDSVSAEVEKSCSIMNGKVIGFKTVNGGDLLLPVPLMISPNLKVFKINGKDKDEYIYTDGNVFIGPSFIFSIKSRIGYFRSEKGEIEVFSSKKAKRRDFESGSFRFFPLSPEYNNGVVISLTNSQTCFDGHIFESAGYEQDLRLKIRESEEHSIFSSLMRKDNAKRVARKELRKVKKFKRRLKLQNLKEKVKDFIKDKVFEDADDVKAITAGVITALVVVAAVDYLSLKYGRPHPFWDNVLTLGAIDLVGGTLIFLVAAAAAYSVIEDSW